MRTFPALALAGAGAVACKGAMAQDRNDVRAPHTLGARTTVGAAPSEPAMQAPIGHRQPRADSTLRSETNGPAVSPYDQEIDRHLDICRGC